MLHSGCALVIAIRYALGASVVAGLVITAAPIAAQDDEEATGRDRVQVTGSRLKRSDPEGAFPIQVIDRQQIELSGQTSVADLLRQQPINSAGSFRPQSGSTGQAFAGLSLRALGTGRTLILIDGRRAPIAPNVGVAQDLNSIPLAAVERIEILSDGASAIYGSDAIGGVVNIITRSNFEGVEMTLGISDPKREGGETREGSVVMGMSGDRGKLMFGVGNNKRDIIFARDRRWSQGAESVFSNNFLNSNFTFFSHPQFGSANTVGCQGPGFSVSGPRCFYDFKLVSADEAEVENQSLFARGRYDINRDWSIYLNANVSRVRSFGRYAPVTSFPWLVGGFDLIVLSPGLPNHPATPPSMGGLNPLWADYQDSADDILLLTHRFAANGPRDTSTDGQVYDFDVGVQGRIGNFDLDVGLRRTESQYNELGRNYIVSALAQPQFDSGAYNIYDPFNVPLSTLQSFTATINRDARYVSREAYALASTELFELGAGPVGLAWGAEWRDEDYKDIFDDLQANGNITGSGENDGSASGGREQWAVFAEAIVPVLDNLELNFAARYDDYSDFGDAFSPKVAFRYQPIDSVAIRGSCGQGFRAPPLDILSQQPVFRLTSVGHLPFPIIPPPDPTQALQIPSFLIANPNLTVEDSEQFSLGVHLEPFDWLSGSFDFWNIEIDGRFANVQARTVIDCLVDFVPSPPNCPSELSLFPTGSAQPDPSLGLGIEVRLDGSPLFVQNGFANLDTIETDGFDINLRTNFDFGRAGRLNTEILGVYTRNYEVDSGENVAGKAGLPRWRASMSNVYSFGDFSFAWNMNYIDSQSDSLDDPDVGLSSWITHDVQLNYFTPWNGRITLGVDNLVDKDPVLDDGESRGFNFSLYDGYGRVPYLRYTQKF